jgi:DNA-binding transcriptional regulator YhcF (GntR family)
MQYNFTDGARQALGFARDWALKWRHDYVGPEHILIGVVRTAEFSPLMERLGLDKHELVSAVQGHLIQGGTTRDARRGELPYTSRAKKVIELSMAAARDMQHNYVGVEHFLLGLMRERTSIAAQVLTALGVTDKKAIAAVLGIGPEALARFHVRIDDAADVSIYEQITAQVQEAVATGTLTAGERLPTVRQLADELDIAPGTVARAYSELERRGIVITGGARGTRVAQPARSATPDTERPETLAGLLRPVAVAAFHLGATAPELRIALERAMTGIFANAEPDTDNT